jgi:ankyrin repeat protein
MASSTSSSSSTPRARDRPEWDRLLSSAQKNNAAEIRRLITEENVSPSHSNAINQSALHIACLWGNIDAVQALLSHSADIKAQNRITGASPLHSCAQSSKTPAMNRVKCAELLIDAGADVHLKDLYGLTPLEYLEAEAERGGFDMDDEYASAMMGVLKDGEAHNQQDLVIIPLVEAQDLNVEALAKYLEGEDHNVNVDERHPKTGKTALYVAIDRLIEIGNESTKEKEMCDLSSMIKLLLSKGSDANAIPEKNVSDNILPETITPMYIICKALSTEYAKLHNDSERSISVSRTYLEEICLSLLSNGAKFTTATVQMMHDAARRGYTDVIKFWIEKLGIDPNVKGRQGLTPLHFAARSGKVEVVKLLLTFSSVNPSIVDDRGKTAMDGAQVNGKDEIVELLTRATQ